MLQLLDSRLRKCTVRIRNKTGKGYGTGFFVAPGLVLTCAHVVGDKNRHRVEISWDGHDLVGKLDRYLASSSFDQSKSDWPDISLISLNLTEHPCVLLIPDTVIGDEMYSFGYTDMYPNGDSCTILYEGPSSTPDMLKIKMGQIRPGLSGAPLFNLRTGGVCGIVKKTRGRSSDIGGRAISTKTVISYFKDLVFLQSSYHVKNNSWIREMTIEQRKALYHVPRDIDTKLAPIGFSSQEAPDVALSLIYHLTPTELLKFYGGWSLASPRGAYIRSLVVDPIEPSTLYLGMDKNQGFYKSNDGGISWVSAIVGLGCKSVNDIRISPFYRTIYLATDLGVWISENNGDTWDLGQDQLKDQEILRVVLSPHDPDLIGFGTRRPGGSSFSAGTGLVGALENERIKPRMGLVGQGFYISKDSGENWETFPVETTNDVTFCECNSQIAYIASIDGGLYRTDDGFESLIEIVDFRAKKPNSVAVAPVDSNVVVVGTLSGLYMSWDGGLSWQKQEEIGNVQVSDVEFFQSDPTRIIASTNSGVFESHNTGKTWFESNDGLDHHWAMAVDTTANSVFLATSGGGVFRRGIEQKNWVAYNKGLPTIPCLSLVAIDDIIFAGCSSGVHRSQDGGNSWRLIGLDGQSICSLVGFSKDISHTKTISGGLHFSVDGGRSLRSSRNSEFSLFAGTQTGKIFYSNNSGKSWKEIYSPGEDSIGRDCQCDIQISKYDRNVLYICIGNRTLYRSSDQGLNWQLIGKETLGNRIFAVKLDELEGETLFVGASENKLYLTTDGGQTWEVSETKFPAPISCIECSTTDPNKVFVVTLDGGVYCSVDRGKNFDWLRDVSAGSEYNKWNVLALSPLDSRLLYLGTSEGAFRSTDGGLSFEPIKGGLLGNKYHVNALEIARDRIYAGMKEGIFFASIPELEK